MALPSTLHTILSIHEEPASIQHLSLEMTPKSWFAHRHHFPKEKGLYMMFGYLQSYHCLRIGMAAGAQGIFGRWFTSISAHHKAFLNPIQGAEHYHKFYCAMNRSFPNIDLVFLLYPHHCRKEIGKLERAYIKYHQPIWELRHNTNWLWKHRK